MHCLIMNDKGGFCATTAELMAKAGYSVSLISQQIDEGSKVAKTIEARGGRALALQADVCDYKDVERAFDEAEQSLGALHAVIHLAEIPSSGSLEESGLQTLFHGTAANAVSFIFCCREASRRMAFSRGGRGGIIINITAQATFDGKETVVYDCTPPNSTIDIFTTDFSRRVAAEGIRVANVRLVIFPAMKTGSLSEGPEDVAMVDDTRSVNYSVQLEQIAETVLGLCTTKQDFNKADI